MAQKDLQAKRIAFHNLLCEILGCPTEGKRCRCYFQPPSSIRMTYPAIVYELDDVYPIRADNRTYLKRHRYMVTLIDKNVDSNFLEPLEDVESSSFQRFYTADDLNHWTFQIYQ